MSKNREQALKEVKDADIGVRISKTETGSSSLKNNWNSHEQIMQTKNQLLTLGNTCMQDWTLQLLH